MFYNEFRDLKEHFVFGRETPRERKNSKTNFFNLKLKYWENEME